MTKNYGLGDDDALQQAVNSQQAEIDELKGKLERLMAQWTHAQRENESLRGQVSSLQEVNKSLQNNVSKVKSALIQYAKRTMFQT